MAKKAPRSASVGRLFERRGRRVKSRRRRESAAARQVERLEDRRVMAFQFVSAYAQSGTPFYVSGVTTGTPELEEAPQQVTLRFGPGVTIDPATLGVISVARSGKAGDGFGAAGTVTDVPVAPGSVVVNDAPNGNEVIVRFAENLPDDSYQIVIGAGLRSKAGDSLAAPVTLNVRLDLGAHVVSVVPQPVTRDPGTGALTQSRNTIEVYFNRNDPLDTASAQTASLYRLVQMNAAGADVGVPVNPTGVVYDPTAGKAVLTFATGAIADDQLFRLEIGGAATVAPAAAVAEGADGTNSRFFQAEDLGALGATGATVNGAIDVRPTVSTATGGALGIPSQPGTIDEPGHRDTPVDSGAHGEPFATIDPATGLVTIQYNFKDHYGDDPQGNPLHNVITEAQKQRAREIFELYSLYAGVRFVETADQGLTVATGDLRAISPDTPTTPAGMGGWPNAVMNSLYDWGQSEYGGSWFSVAMHEIGHALGLQHSIDVPSIMGGGVPDAVYPGNYDIEHVRQLPDPAGGTGWMAPTSNDIDLYKFSIAQAGTLTAETFVARPGQPVTSLADTVISLYREEGGRRTLIARNDNYYGRDSFLRLALEAGTYYVAVTSTGNADINPEVADSGDCGRTEGAYQLKLGFAPATAAANTILDTTGKPLDGDRDGVAGGAFTFWFNTASADNTIYVDKANTAAGGGDGSLGNPYKTISAAIAAAGATTRVIRIAGNTAGANGTPLPYLVGVNAYGRALADGATFNVPKGVTVMIDAGAVFKFGTAVIDVGSSSELVNRAAAALQVLGTPAASTVFTSLYDDTVGGISDGFAPNAGPAATAGQWGGVVLRQDSDAASKLAFVNSISGATFRYGGGKVRVDGQLENFASIQMESTRPTVVFNTVANGAGAAIAATPNSFEDTTDRVGPELRGNVLTGNSINGLFVKIDTQFGTPLEKLDVPARFKSTDIVYVIQENLVINGGVGGYEDRLIASLAGNLTAGSAVVTNLASTADLVVGARVVDLSESVPAGTTIESIDSPTQITLSAPVTTSVVGQSLDFYFGQKARQSGRLTIDPGVVVKLQGSRIELERGIAQLVAEGTASKPVVFTSLADNRYGAGGTFDTNGTLADKFDARGVAVGTLTTGDWGGIVLNAGSMTSIDHAYLGFGGGQTPIEGAFDSFNVIETHQGDLRLANSRVEYNAAGTASTSRNGRGSNAAATVFVNGAQPIIVGNDFRQNAGALISINANSLADVSRSDVGRSTGSIDRFAQYDDNLGPLVRGNMLSYTPAAGLMAIAGMVVRGSEITVEGVWDDTDIVHVLQNEIIVNNLHTATGMRLVSRPDASLVVKLDGAAAGFTAAGFPLDIDDRIGGTVQVVGQPGYPVVLTSLRDDTVGASLDTLGQTVKDTNVDGTATMPAAGDWRSLQFQAYSNDRNVAVVSEGEKPLTGGVDTNDATGSAQWLGVLAPNYPTGTASFDSAQEKSGDENRRLGFEVHGQISPDAPGDVDVYSFTGYAGSTVWIDVDKTAASLDAMVELLDAAGRVLARSIDAEAEGGVIQAEEQVDDTGGTTVTYQLDPGSTDLLPDPATPATFSILPGTLTGTLYDTDGGAPVAIQTFSFDAAGVVRFQNILGSDRDGAPLGAAGTATGAAVAATLNAATGQLTFTFNGPNGIGTNYIEVRYAYKTTTFSAATLGIAQPLGQSAVNGADFYSLNPRDPGMCVVLPGTPGTQTQYFIRVRSQKAYDTATAPAQDDYETDLRDEALVHSGATAGRYELRVRLQQRDEKPGSTVLYADIRYPTTGIDVQGLPRNSLLLGELGENPTDNNNTFANAQYVGNVLQSDRNAISVAGKIATEDDIDWYTFAVNYENIQAIPGINDTGQTFAAMFDIDYADGFRGDLSFALFDERGTLLYISRDSNIADDQPAAGRGTDFADLARASLGKLDPFLSTVTLGAGVPDGVNAVEDPNPEPDADPARQTRYYVAVFSNKKLPTQLDAMFNVNSANIAVRLEPLASVARVVNNGIGAAGPNTIVDTANLGAHVAPFTLSDVTLFVSTATGLQTVDAMRGGVETTVSATFGSNDIVMRSDGRLYGYRGLPGVANTAGTLDLIDSGTGARTNVGNDDIPNLILATTPTVTQTNLAPQQLGVGNPSTFQLANGNLQAATLTGTLQYSGTVLGVPTTGTWTFTSDAAGALTYTDVVAPAGLAAPVGGTVNPTTGLVSVTWSAPVAMVGVSLVTTTYTYNVPGDPNSVTTDNVDALAWQRTGVGQYANLFLSVRDGTQSRLYPADTTTGEAGDRIGTFIQDAGNTLGIVTGMAFDGGTLYGVDDRGNFFTIDPATAVATNVIAIAGAPAFAGLAIGPQNLYGGALAHVLFAIDAGGTLRALDTTGNLQAVFDADGDGIAEATSIATGVGGATGLAFSPLDINLWHNTAARADGGGTPMYFGLENGGAQFGVVDANWQADLLSNPAIANTYNLPGGAYGSLTTDSFSLAGYDYTDKPTLYFSYWLQTDDAAGAGQDRARAFVSIDGGVSWELLATNSNAGELPGFASVSSRITGGGPDVPGGDPVNQKVQQLFDTANWRQVRVDLGEFAGRADIRLRFDFTTASVMDATARDAAGNLLNTIIDNANAPTPPGPNPGAANLGGNFNNAVRGQNNRFEGFYIDRLIVGFAERGEQVTNAAAGQTGFTDLTMPDTPVQVLAGEYQLEIRRGTELAVGDATQVFDTNDPLIPSRATNSGFGPKLGDPNHSRQQGQLLIQSNIISNAANYGISIDAAARDANTGAPIAGVSRNFATLNGSRLAPGAVVMNNVIASGGTGGILFSGDPNTGNVPLAAVPFGRIVNNTIYGRATPGGIGVNVTQNAGPTLLNNIFANLAEGVRVDGTSAANTVVGMSAYWNTATQVTGVTQSGQLALTGNPFVNAAARNFYLVDGSRAIDSALGSLQDRANYRVVTAPLGIPASPIIAPERDLYGQLRGDDPAVAPPSPGEVPGLGRDAFQDRGAIDRVDFTQPWLTLLNPSDNDTGGSDQNPATDAVTLKGTGALGVTQFTLQLNDVGAGVDKATVTSAAFSITRNGTTLVEGTDYTFRYLESSNRLVFEAAAVFRTGTYVITATSQASANNVAGLLTDLANNTILPNKADGKTSFEIRLVGVPDAPTALTGTVGEGQVTLQWLPPANDGGAPITNYVVQYSTDQLTWQPPDGQLVGGPTPAYVMTGLTNGTPYFFRVSAVNDAGQGPWVQTSVAITPFQPAPAPVGLAAVRGNTFVTLTWAPPSGTGFGTILDYRVEFKTGTGAWSTFNDGVGTTPRAVVTGLTNGVTYQFRVTTITNYGPGLPSDPPVSATPENAPAPLGLAATRGNTFVTLTWDAPTDTWFGSIVDYRVEFKPSNGTWTTVTDDVSPTTGATVTGLTNGVTYQFRVTTITQPLPAGPSNVAGGWALTSATPETAPAPVGLLATRGNTFVTLTWDAPPGTWFGSIVDYRVEFKPSNGTWTTVTDGVSPTTGATVTGLTKGTAYQFRVTTITRPLPPNPTTIDGLSAVANETPGSDAAPLNLSATSGDTSVTLTWNDPQGTWIGTISDYRVEVSADNGATWTTFDDGQGATPGAVVTGLTNGVSYRFRVTTITEYGDAAAAEVAGMPVGVPLAPTGLVVTFGDRQLFASWNPLTSSVDTGGSAITDYVVEYSPDGVQWTTVNDGTGTTPRATISGLVNNTPYFVRVAAVNIVGQGDFAQTALAVAPRALAGAPTRLTGRAGNGFVDLAWTAPRTAAGVVIIGYRVQASTNGGASWAVVANLASAATKATVAVPNGVPRIFRVAAVTVGGGAGAYSTPTATLIPYSPTAVPTAPTSVSAIRTAPGTVQLTWTPPPANAGGPVNGYVIQYRLSTSTRWSSVTLTGPASTATVARLLAGRSYVFRVSARNLAGLGLPSIERTVTA